MTHDSVSRTRVVTCMKQQRKNGASRHSSSQARTQDGAVAVVKQPMMNQTGPSEALENHQQANTVVNEVMASDSSVRRNATRANSRLPTKYEISRHRAPSETCPCAKHNPRSVSARWSVRSGDARGNKRRRVTAINHATRTSAKVAASMAMTSSGSSRRNTTSPSGDSGITHLCLRKGSAR